MTDTPENLVLEHLRHIRATLDRIERTQREHGDRLTTIELAIAGLRRERAIDAETAAMLGARLDRVIDRVDRIERRLDLAPPE